MKRVELTVWVPNEQGNELEQMRPNIEWVDLPCGERIGIPLVPSCTNAGERTRILRFLRGDQRLYDYYRYHRESGVVPDSELAQPHTCNVDEQEVSDAPESDGFLIVQDAIVAFWCPHTSNIYLIP